MTMLDELQYFFPPQRLTKLRLGFSSDIEKASHGQVVELATERHVIKLYVNSSAKICRVLCPVTPARASSAASGRRGRELDWFG